MHNITMPFLGQDFSMKLPESWRVLDELRPKSMPALGDLPSALHHALQHPIGCDPLASSDLFQKKIVIAIDDISRPTPLYRYFDVIIKFLIDHGASREHMLVVTALGMHRPMTTQEIEAKIGAGFEERFLAHFSLQALRKNEIFVYSPNLPSDTGRRLGIIRQFPDVASMLNAAGKYAPTRARVYVCPHEGVTYPILSG